MDSTGPMSASTWRRSDFADFLRTFPQQGFAGGNVTIPHKEAAFAGVDRRTARAERVRAVNTLWVENGVLWGDNTDVAGFVDNLDASLGTGWEQYVGTVSGDRCRRRGAGRDRGPAGSRIRSASSWSTAPSKRRDELVRASLGRARWARAGGRGVRRASGSRSRSRADRQHHVARHGGPAAARPRSCRCPRRTPSWRTSSTCR